MFSGAPYITALWGALLRSRDYGHAGVRAQVLPITQEQLDISISARSLVILTSVPLKRKRNQHTLRLSTLSPA